MKKFILGIFIILTVFFINNSFAQIQKVSPRSEPVSAIINAKGTVLAPISILSTRDLDFGNDILPGTPKFIDKISNSAGKFTIMGQSDKEINISIIPPVKLTNGNSDLEIHFNSNDAAYSLEGSLNEFDPMNPVNATFGQSSQMDILIGGTVIPTDSQEGGYYEGMIIFQFNYTGN